MIGEIPLAYWIVLGAGAVFAFVFFRPRDEFGASRYIGLLGGEDGEIEAWGVDSDLRQVSRGFPDLAEAKAMLRNIHTDGGAYFESGEEALSAALLGLTRCGDQGDFVEIHCISSDRANARVGMSVTGTRFEQSAPCNGVIALDRLVGAYFAGAEAFGTYWYDLPGRTEFHRGHDRPAPASRPS